MASFKVSSHLSLRAPTNQIGKSSRTSIFKRQARCLIWVGYVKSWKGKLQQSEAASLNAKVARLSNPKDKRFGRLQTVQFLTITQWRRLHSDTGHSDPSLSLPTWSLWTNAYQGANTIASFIYPCWGVLILHGNLQRGVSHILFNCSYIKMRCPRLS